MRTVPDEYACKMHDFFDGFQASPFHGVTSLAPTGEKFWTFTSAGFKEEGIASKVFETVKEAAEEYLDQLVRNFISFRLLNDGHILYWRERPYLEETDTGYRIYSRFLISNRDVNLDIIKGGGRK